MNSTPELTTPIYVKTDPNMPWPSDPSFYLLTANGLFLCRNHEFFSSCVAARRWPGELALQQRGLTLRYPPIPKAEFERIVGFFGQIAEIHGSEAAVLLVWDRSREVVRVVVPDQVAGVSEGWSGRRYAKDVRYEQPLDLPPHQRVIGSVHSHVEGAAYASATDKDDEAYKPGLHVVVGRISTEPPDLHCEVVVDGSRFTVDPSAVLEGYETRDDGFPPEWIDRVQVEIDRPPYSTGWSTGTWNGGGDQDPPSVDYEPYGGGGWS